MRIPKFTIENNRSIRLASCDQMPRIMILTGPNGCGKSTLLDALRKAPGPNGPILYVGPHRTSGRQQVSMRFLAGNKLSMRQLQSAQNLPNYEGIIIHQHARSAWDFDETSSYLKYALCQIELDRQTALAERFDKEGEIVKGAMPDIWKPLKEMTENLLPHLHFNKIDVTDRDQVQCLWNVHTKNIQIDIDDLSSGEKAIIQLFFPLIENRIQARLERSKGADENPDSAPATEEVCVLMDEPELHLHPNLQGKILDYLRNLAICEHVQFVLATHSPIIVEQATSDELFLLRPSEIIAPDVNQLSRIASDDEKLALMREVFGSTSNITAMRNILVVEGTAAKENSKSASDQRLFGFLSDRFGQVTVRPGGSKTQCRALAKNLSEILFDELSSQLQAFALVDRDVDAGEPDEDYVHLLPVSMIENLLVDPEVIWNAIVTVRHRVALEDQQELETALDAVFDDLHEHETARRIKAGIGFHKFRLTDPVDEAQRQAEEHIAVVREAVSDDALNELRSRAVQEVQRLFEEHSRREHFDGKKVLLEFYRRHMHASGMSKEIFVYECARRASDRKRVQQFVNELFNKMGLREPEEAGIDEAVQGDARNS